MALTQSTKVKSNQNYIEIKNHGAIFNNRTAVLVGIEGTMDWACFPNFDSKPVFDSILDFKKGGYFSVKPACDNLISHQYYEEFTNILITEFFKDNQIVLRLTDFLPISKYSTVNMPEIHRFIEAPKTDVDIKVEFKPNFNYGKEIPTIEHSVMGYIFHGTESSVGIASNFKFRIKDNKIYNNKISLKAGTYQWVVITTDIKHLHKINEYKSYVRLEQTRDYWKNWVNEINYHGLYHKYLLRSALALKGLFYEPTGMMVAAPTSSLPETLQGERNWDYRFTWIRDTSYVIEALSMIGLKDEATKFLYDLMDKIHNDKKMKTIYEINSESTVEEILDYDGYMGSKPVRMGNKASEQLQIDQYGSIINAIYNLYVSNGMITLYLWDFVMEILEELKHIWQYPDSSIWEFRNQPRHYVYSKLLSWLAFDRAILMGRAMKYSAPYNEWDEIKNTIKNDIIKNGYNENAESFVQYYGSEFVDASLLIMPIVGFLPVNDFRIKNTIKKIEKDLMQKNFLIKRYNEYDGINSEDNAFLLLSFWYVEDLLLMNRIEDAKHILEHILSNGNDLMLFSEEVDLKTGEMLGNFPQAITHLGVIRAIIKLNEKIKTNRIQKY